MTEEHPPTESYESNKLRKLLNKTSRQTDLMDDPRGVIFPTRSLANLLRPLIRDELLVLAPYGMGRLIDTEGNIFSPANMNIEESYMDLRLTDTWALDEERRER